MSTRSRNWIASAAAALVAALVLAACGGDSSSTDADSSAVEGAAGGDLVFARAFEPVSFNPLLTDGDNGSIWEMAQIYDQLVEYQPGSYDVQPGLAKSWEVSDDGLTYTFDLRDANFSDGSPVTAEDVKFSIDRYGDPKINTAYAALLAPEYESSEITDDSTFVIHLSKPDGGFLAGLATPMASITPEKAVKSEGEKGFGENPIGSGPFMLEKWERGKTVVMKRNPEYWKEGLPLLDSVTFNYVPDDNTRMLQVREGQADVAESVPFQQIAELDSQADVDVQTSEIVAYDAIWLNNDYEPLGDKNVRQALNYALDKEAINQAVYAGKAEPANSTLAKLQYWDPDVPGYAVDLDKAKQLMADSQYANGFDLNLKVPGGDSVHKNVAEIAKDAWAELGVNVTIETQETNALFGEFAEGNYQAAIPLPKITSDVLVPDELAIAWLRWEPGYQSFFTQYKNPEVSKLVTQANRATDSAERESLWQEVQSKSMDDAPWVPIVFPPASTGIRSNVENFQTLRVGWWDLAETSISP